MGPARAAVAITLTFGLLTALPALAHPRGFHKRTVLTLSARSVEALVTLDLDSGKRSALLRQGADLDGDGALSEPEAAALKKKLAGLAARSLKVTISSFGVPLAEEDSKLSLRGDARALDEGLSVAVLLRAVLPGAVTPGMTLEVADSSPDRSHVELQVYQASAEDGGAEAPARRELQHGERLKVRLGRLR